MKRYFRNMSFTSARRDLNLVIGAKAVSWLGDEVATIALVLVLQASGRGAAAVADLLIANALPMVLFSGLVGRLIDRVDNRALLIGSSLIQAGLCVLLAFVHAPGLVLLLVALLGAGQCVNSATWAVTLAAIAGRDDLAKATARSQAAVTLAAIAAPALGGFLVGQYGSRVPLLLDAATFVAVFAAAALLRTRRADRPAQHTERPRGGLAIVRGDALLRPLFVLLALFVLIGSMVNVVDVFLVRDTLGASPTWYGITGAAYAVGMFGGALLAGRLHGMRALAGGFVGAIVVLGTGVACMGLMPAVGWLLPCCLVAGAGNGVLSVALSTLVVLRTDPAARGRIVALLNGTSSGTQLVAFAVGGALLTALNPRTMFVLAGATALLVPLVLGRRVLRAATEDRTADSAEMTDTALAA